MHCYPELKFQNEGHSWYLRVLFCKYYQSQGRNPLQYFPVLTEICNSWFFLVCNITKITPLDVKIDTSDINFLKAQLLLERLCILYFAKFLTYLRTKFFKLKGL